MHVGKRELVLALRLYVLGVLLAEEIAQGTLLRPFLILLGCHQQGDVQIGVADLRSHVIDVG